MQEPSPTAKAVFMEIEEVAILLHATEDFVANESNSMKSRNGADALRSQLSTIFWGKDVYRPRGNRCGIEGCFRGPHELGTDLCPLHIEMMDEAKTC